MEFESPDVEKEFPGLYASETSKRSNESDFSDDAHERPSKKDLLIGKRKDKKDSKKDRGYAALGGESSPEEDSEMKSPSKSKKTKSFKFPSSSKKEKREKSREKDGKEKEREADKEKKKEKEAKTKLKIKERKKSKHGDDVVEIGDEQPVFGVPLQLAVTRSRCHDGVDIPLVVREAIDYLQDHGVTMEGVFKVSGIKSKVHHLRRAYDRREPAALADYEPPTVTSLLKVFLRELPEPLLTAERLPRFEEAAACREVVQREVELRGLVAQLPHCNQQLLAWIVLHLENITLHEKQTKMNAQSIAIALSPVLQMSHRLLSAFLCHAKSLFPDVTLHKYVPPLPGSSPAMPDTAPGIAGELRKQESLLTQLHQEMNAGCVSKSKEEQLWEVQRIITQLKRKLRTFQRSLDTGQSQKSMDEERKPSDEEFQMDLSLQKAHSCSEEDSSVLPTKPATARVDAVVVAAKPIAAHVDPAAVATKPAAANVDTVVVAVKPVAVRVEPSVVSTVPAAAAAAASVDAADPAPVAVAPPPSPPTPATPLTPPPEEEEEDVLDTPCDPTPTVSSLEDVTTGAGGAAEELQGLLQEETLLQLEQQELLTLQADLQGRVQGEREEIEKLRTELEIARIKYNYRGFGCDSSDASSSPSLSDISDAEDPEVESRMQELRQENLLLQQKKSTLVRRIMEEREACLHLRVQVSLMRLSQESKQL